MTRMRCVNLRDWESRHLLAHGTLTLVRPVNLVAPYVMDERDDGKPWPYATTWSFGDDGVPWMPCPFGMHGDPLIGRECWCEADELFDTNYRISQPQTVGYRSDKTALHWSSPAAQPKRVDHPSWNWEASCVKWLSAATMPAWAARHRMTVESVVVKRCDDINRPSDAWFDAIGSGASDPYAAASDALVSGDALVKEVRATWPEKRFPWATSYAWVVKARRQA